MPRFQYQYPEKDLLRGARTAIENCMGYKTGETVLILTDTEHERVGQLFYRAALEMGLNDNPSKGSIDLKYVVMTPTGRNGAEPVDAEIPELMKKFDIAMLATAYSLTHTKARKEANKVGVRIASMPRITEYSLAEGGMRSDYNKVERLTNRMLDAMRDARQVRITTPYGTNLTLKMGKYSWQSDTGIFRKKGDFGNLPGGELCTAPEEESGEGTLVVNWMGSTIDSPAKLTVKKGRIVDGDERIMKSLEEVGDSGAYLLAELGIGTNPSASDLSSVLESEKIKGTVHIGIGNNVSYGGSNDVPNHQDGIMDKPTMIVDGKVIIRDGIWLI